MAFDWKARVELLLKKLDIPFKLGKPVKIEDLRFEPWFSLQNNRDVTTFDWDNALKEIEATLGIVRRGDYADRLREAEMLSTHFIGPVGTRVTPRSGSVSGAIVRYAHSGGLVIVKLDRDHQPLVAYSSEQLKLEGITIMRDLKIDTKTAVDGLIKDQPRLSKQQNEVRRLGIGLALAALANTTKDEAKKRLKKLGIIPAKLTKGQKLLFDDTIKLVATTAAAGERLNKAALEKALDAEPRITGPMKARIMKAAYKKATASTSFTVA